MAEKWKQDLFNQIYPHCLLIEQMFKTKCEVTVFVRNPELKDGDVLVTSERDLDVLAAAIAQMKSKEQVGG